MIIFTRAWRLVLWISYFSPLISKHICILLIINIFSPTSYIMVLIKLAVYWVFNLSHHPFSISLCFGYSIEKTDVNQTKLQEHFQTLRILLLYRRVTLLMWSWYSPSAQLRTGAGNYTQLCNMRRSIDWITSLK